MAFSRKNFSIGFLALLVVLVGGWFVAKSVLSNMFSKGPTEGPFTADGVCPCFKSKYQSCNVAFGNSGLSTLNSLYETFMGEGAFEIYGFTVDTPGEGRYTIAAQSNRGPITSEIYTDRLVRLGQDRENEVVNRTQQSAFCDMGRIYEHQVVYTDDNRLVQDLEFWSEDGKLRFRLFQDGAPTADITCQ